jgi:Flp pilus assembly protein CpaB
MRLRRPRLRDPRLLVGVVLVLLGVLLGALALDRVSATTRVLVARESIPVGQDLTADSVLSVEVRLGETETLYVSSPDQVPAGSTALRSVQAGEMIPLSAIGQGGGADLRPVVIPVDRSVADSVAPGRPVEIWRTSAEERDDPAVAELIVADAQVRAVSEGSTLGARSVGVEVLVPSTDVPVVLESIARGDRLDVIGVPGAGEVSP